MTEVPKIVYDRLRAAQTLPFGRPDQAHPDADSLSAFAERSLSATERDGVLHHLTSCGECREIVALALSAVEAPILPATSDREAREPQSSAEASWTAGRFASMKPAWLRLGAVGFGSGPRWTALAAGVVVVISVLALYPGKSTRQIATNISSASNPQIASSSAPKSPDAPGAKTSQLSSAKSADVQQPLGLPRSDSDKGGVIAAGKHLDALTRRSAASPVVPAPAITSQMSTVSNLMARNEAPAIEKAKPALQGAETQAADSDLPRNDYKDVGAVDELKKQKPRDATSASTLSTFGLASPGSPRPMATAKIVASGNQSLDQIKLQWTIAGGVLQRSVDDGQSWQDSLHPSHPLLCYANHGQDIWAGGQAGTLFHSTNSGMTWAQVQPSSNGPLSSDLTHIDLQGDAPDSTRITISTGNNEMWISTRSEEH